MNPLLEIRNVSLSYHTVSGETKALSNISFDLMPGEFLAVVGPSGCGKSTLLNLICGMLPAEEGTILMNGIPPSPGDPRIGYMLQKDHLLEWRSIYRNILLGHNMSLAECGVLNHILDNPRNVVAEHMAHRVCCVDTFHTPNSSQNQICLAFRCYPCGNDSVYSVSQRGGSFTCFSKHNGDFLSVFCI